MSAIPIPPRPRSSRWAAGAGLLAAAALAVGGRTTVPARAAAGRVEVLKCPNGGIQPQAAADAAGTVHLVYFKGEARSGDLFYQRREGGKTEWSAPLRVNSKPGSAVAAGTIRGGQLAVGKGGRVHIVWFGATAPADGHGAAPLLYTRLNDDRTAFEPQRNLMQFTGMLDGGGSVAADASGNVYVAFHAAEGKAEGEGNRRLWIVRSADDGRSFSHEEPAWKEPTGACACCSTKAFVDSKGTLHVLYRSATEQVNRDMFLLSSRDRGVTFKGSRVDEWKVSTCPMSSETFAEGPGGVVAAWETSGQVRFAALDPSGKVGHPASAPGSGPNRKHPTLAVNPAGETLFAWTEGTGWNRGGSLAWQVYDRNGQPTREQGRVEGGIPVWGLATAAPRPDGGFSLIH